jgi:hypothetical protein
VGNWLVEGTKKITPEDAHLALVPYHFYQTRGVFAVGSSIPGIKAERYYFNYQDNLVNEKFKDVEPGNGY